MRVSTRILLYRAPSKIGSMAALGEALGLFDGGPEEAIMGARHRRNARAELVALIRQRGEVTEIAEVLEAPTPRP